MDARGAGALARLVGDTEHFAAEVWGRRPCRWSTCDSFGDLLSTADVESLLRRHARRPSFRVVREGPTIPESEYVRSVHLGGATVDDVADVERVLAHLAGGATLVMQGLQHTWEPLARLCAAIEAETDHRTQANAYLSPSGSTALRPHSDTHDVFALQLEGSKHWVVDGLGELATEPGDVLYIPARVRHAAAARDRSSLHVTIGIHARTTEQALLALVGDVARELGLDAPLPIGFRHDAAVAETLRSQLRDAVTMLSGALRGLLDDPDAIERVTSRERSRGHRPTDPPPGSLAAVLDLGSLGDDTVVRLRAGARLREEDDLVIVSDARQQLTVPIVAAPALRALSSAGELRVGELPGLDASSRVVLARRLIRDGFALPVPVGPSGS